MDHSRKKLDLTGQKFGKLTVLAPAENINARTAWLCRCECGKEIVAKTVRLRNGHCTSCGCDKGLSGSSPGVIGRASLTYVDGTCVEMIRASTVRCNNTSGVPGVDWHTQKQRWRATSRASGTIWAATSVSRTPSRPESGRKRSCTSPSWPSTTWPPMSESILPFLPFPRRRAGGIYVQTKSDDNMTKEGCRWNTRPRRHTGAGHGTRPREILAQRNLIGKPRETVGRKANFWGLRYLGKPSANGYYVSPAAGIF